MPRSDCSGHTLFAIPSASFGSISASKIIIVSLVEKTQLIILGVPILLILW